MRIALALALLTSSAASATDSFEDRSGGTRLVFATADLPNGDWFEIAPGLTPARRARARAILEAEARKYPPGFLAAVGVKAIGVFDGLATAKNDGFHTWDKRLGGYRYFGLWNGRNAVMASYYSDEQLPLTFHHEVFHHIDGTVHGETTALGFSGDDARFKAAVAGKRRYAAPAIDEADLAALGRASGGSELKDAVGQYSKKNPGEDQAETARWMMTNLPDALVQVATRPNWAGSQRVLHLLTQYAGAAPSRGAQADLAWFVNAALGREGRAPARPAAARSAEELIRPQGAFVVRGGEDRTGVNHTLQADIRAVGEAVARTSPGCSNARKRASALLEQYREYIAGHWSVSASTARVFAEVQGLLLAPCAPARNAWSSRVDEAIADPTLRRAILSVQPTAVRLSMPGSGGSGVLVDPSGLVLTAAHVPKRRGARLTVELPDGRSFAGTCTAINTTLDLALLRLDVPVGTTLPAAALAPNAPRTGSLVVAIGQPGSYTPDGGATGYQPFHISVGRIRGFRGDRLGPQALGGTKHDAWTYWGHSGCPLYDSEGRLVAMHNSWDSTTAMRHAVTWEAINQFLAGAR